MFSLVILAVYWEVCAYLPTRRLSSIRRV